MANEVDTNQNRITTPIIIYFACFLGFLGSLLDSLHIFTELAYMVGQWYLNFLLISLFIIWISLLGIWKMRKWAVVVYTIVILVTQVILFNYNIMWGYRSLIIPAIVIVTIWLYFKKMIWILYFSLLFAMNCIIVYGSAPAISLILSKVNL